MADKTEYVNYSGFGNHIEVIHSLGLSIEVSLNKAYNELGNLKTATGWKGPQYDKLVKCFNDMRDGFDTILEDIGYKIPNMMNSAAKAWAAVDGASFAEKLIETMKPIVTLVPSGEPALTWNKDAVDTARKSIEGHLDSATNDIKELATKFKAMNTDWQGQDFDDNLKDINSYSNDVAAKVDELKSDFVKYMNESIAAYDEVRKSVSEWK